MDKIEIIIYISFMFLLIVIGWCLNEVYRSYAVNREFSGLYLKDTLNHSDALKTAYDYDSYGNWVCVNIKGMTYREAIKTCSHEVGHEIFADKFEDDPEKILEVLEQ